jgi:peptidoglycan/LPS O-acetylase OafA/YrhL
MLPFSEEAFNAPAWSLSLEWQFYLIAPFAVLVALRQKWLPQFAFLLFLAEIAMRKSSFGQFTYPSFLPAASGYFAVGIASRLAYARLHCALRDPMMFYSLGVVLLPLVGDETKPIVAWMMLVIGLEAPRTAPSDKFGRWLRYALESRPVRFLGSRSYSTYLCHMAVIAICHRLWLSASPQATPAVTFLALIFMTVPLTLVASELLYRAVERPGIALGSTIAAWIISRSAAPLPFPRRA